MISVCLASFNGEKYIKEQLISILSQLAKNDEIIVSDDCSKDKTVEIIKAFNDPRIRIFHNSKKEQREHAAISNFENALKYANGDFIFLSDQDDIWLPNKVENMLTELNKYDLVFSDATIVDKDLYEMKRSFFDGKTNLTGFTRNIFFNNYIGATMAFRKKILDYALPFPKLIPMHDQWLGIIGEFYFTTSYINKPLILYRRHGLNASYSGEKSKNSNFKKILYRINLIWSFVKRVFKITFRNVEK